jgi:hypothetical protein
MIDNGSTKTIVNPNGTHTTLIDNGKTKTVVNPDGTHTIAIDNGPTKTFANPDGSHSTIVTSEIKDKKQRNIFSSIFFIFRGR